jgi:DNA-binding beta-propeller fold protein YncE
LSIFTVITAEANHIVYDPYTRKVMASIGSGANANSIVALTPETATLGSLVPIGSGPSGLALSPDGQILYVALTGSNSVARFNMLTQQPDFTVPIGAKYTNGSPITLGGIAVQSGTENTIALNLGAVGTAIYDFNTTTKTAALRGQANDSSGICPQFLDANDLLATTAYSAEVLSSYQDPERTTNNGSAAPAERRREAS